MHEDDDLILPIDETTDTTNPVTRPPRRRISLIVAVVVTLAAFAIGGLLGMFSQARADTPVHVAQSDNVQFLKDLYDQIRYERWYAAEEFALAAVPSDTVLKEADKGDLQAQRQVTQSVEANSITNTLHSDCLDLEMFYNHAAELTAQLPGGSDALRANNLPFNIPIPLPMRMTRTTNAAPHCMAVSSVAAVDASSRRLRPLQFSFSRVRRTGAFTAHCAVCGD